MGVSLLVGALRLSFSTLLNYVQDGGGFGPVREDRFVRSV